MWEKDGRVVYDAGTDVSAGGMFDRATVKGFIQTLPEVPGLLLYAPGHIGIYEGDGYAIEARGFAFGVVRTKVSERTWTHWCACPYISYAGFEEMLRPEPITEPYEALVVTRSSPLNIWTDTRKTRSIKQVKKGDTVVVLGYADALGWLRVQKDHMAGVADGQYLQKIDAPPPNDDEDDQEVLPGSHDPEDVLYTASVVNVKTGLNLRTKPRMDAETILLLPKGATVEVLTDNLPGGFAMVCYASIYGYCTRSYLMQDAGELFYDVVLSCVTKDVVAKVLTLYPAAEVTEAE